VSKVLILRYVIVGEIVGKRGNIVTFINNCVAAETIGVTAAAPPHGILRMN
jgi:hypothetical protein